MNCHGAPKELVAVPRNGICNQSARREATHGKGVVGLSPEGKENVDDSKTAFAFNYQHTGLIRDFFGHPSFFAEKNTGFQYHVYPTKGFLLSEKTPKTMIVNSKEQ